MKDLSTSERIAHDGPGDRPARRTSPPPEERPAWLSIHEASSLIGVSEATLRRWAEAGDVEAFVTPGGHRRFTRAAVLDLLPHPKRPHRTLRELGGTPERIVRTYRRELTATGIRWLPGLDETERETFREPGRRILAGILGYLDSPSEADGAEDLASARAAAIEYGRLARLRSLGPADTTEAFLSFRSPFLEELATIARRRRIESSEAISLIIAAASLFDRLLLALLEGYLAGPAMDVGVAPTSSAAAEA